MTDFQKLYKQYAKDIYNFALFLSGSPDEAEDITAETFARIITSKKAIILKSVKGYMLTIARNLFLENNRLKKYRSEIKDDTPDPKNNIEDNLYHKCELEAVQKFLQKFSEIDRTALLLRAEGIPYSEITKVLNISLASAKVKVHRLRIELARWKANRLK